MKYRKSRKRYISPGIEKLIVILCLALCFLAAVALFSSIGDYELPWLQSEEDLPEEESSTDILPPEDSGGSDNGDNDGDGSGSWEDGGFDSPLIPVEPDVDPDGWTYFPLDTPLIDYTWDSPPVRLPVE